MGLRDKLATTRQKAKERKAGMERLFKFEKGKTRFRFLPGAEVSADFFRDYGLHWLKDENGKALGAVGDRGICYGQEDMIRDGLQQVRNYASSIEDEALDERAKDMLAKRRYIACIEVLESPGETPVGPVLADFAGQAFEDLISIMEDIIDDADDEATGTAELIGPEARVFQIEREGSGVTNTKYTPSMTTKTAKMSDGAMANLISIDDWVSAQFDPIKVAQAAKLVSEMLGRPLDASVIEGVLTSDAGGSTKAISGPETKSIADDLDDEIPSFDADSEDGDASASDDVTDPSTITGGDDLMDAIDAL